MIENIQIVEQLQRACSEVFDEVTSAARAGQSEAEIAQMCRKAFAKRGITEHWYDVPFNVLIGPERFIEGLTTTDYAAKAPSPNIHLEPGSVLYMDFAPMDSGTGQWGDWSKTIVFRPRARVDDEQLAFLGEVSSIHSEGIKQITSRSSGADVANYYLDAYKAHGITLQDVRKNVGHSIHVGPKSQANRIWLDTDNQTPLGEGIFTVEPGGSRPKTDGSGNVVARFEVCIYISPDGGARILGE